MIKTCIRCQKEKKEDAFRLRNNTGKLRNICRECENIAIRKVNNPDDLHQLINLFIVANSMPGEEFLPIKGFEARFKISNFGRIISCDYRKGLVNFMRPHIDSCHYYATQLRMKPENRKVRVHVLVAEHFCNGQNESRRFVNHENGIKTDNYFQNLTWTTPLENSEHAVNTKLFDIKGERHPLSKLTKENVLSIRDLRKNGLIHKEIAAKFGISRKQVGDILAGKNWGWL